MPDPELDRLVDKTDKWSTGQRFSGQWSVLAEGLGSSLISRVGGLRQVTQSTEHWVRADLEVTWCNLLGYSRVHSLHPALQPMGPQSL